MSLQSTDQIADLITRIRNANLVGKTEVSLPTSKLKVAIVDTLVKNGYLKGYEIEKNSPRDILKVIIATPGENSHFTEISKVSKPGRRVYSSAEEIPTIKSGRGTVVVSTSKGVMTGREAKQNHLGGEILVRIW